MGFSAGGRGLCQVVTLPLPEMAEPVMVKCTTHFSDAHEDRLPRPPQVFLSVSCPHRYRPQVSAVVRAAPEDPRETEEGTGSLRLFIAWNVHSAAVVTT